MKLRYLLIILFILAATSIFIGVKDITPLDLFSLTKEQRQILLISRLPRLISILVAGVGLSISGLVMQQLTRNKFVSPTTAGTMDFARLGVLVSLMLFTTSSTLVKITVAFLFALGGTVLFMQILKRIKAQDTIFIPLVGLMLGNIVSSITTFFAYQSDLIQNMSSWLQGDFSLILSGRYELLYLSIPLLIVIFLYANKFTIAGMGEDFSKNLGLNYQVVVNLGLVLVAAISAVVLLTVGSIPFLGLIIPNIVSLYHGDHLKKNIIHTAVLGAIFVLLCDIFGRLIIYPYEISISLTVGVIGSGIFLYLLVRRTRYAS